MAELDIEMKHLAVEKQDMLSRVILQLDDVPTIKTELKKQLAEWLQALPEALSASVSDDILKHLG